MFCTYKKFENKCYACNGLSQVKQLRKNFNILCYVLTANEFLKIDFQPN